MTKLETLDHLVKICVDSAERYRRAAANVSKEKLVQFFQQQEAARRRHADQLNLLRERLGGEGEKSGKESGSIGGFIDRTAMDLSVVMSKGDTGVVDWCRQDVKDVIAEYEKALREADGTARATLERQLAENRATLAALKKFYCPTADRDPELLSCADSSAITARSRNGYGSIGSPFHQLLSGPIRLIAKCSWRRRRLRVATGADVSDHIAAQNRHPLVQVVRIAVEMRVVVAVGL